MTDDTFYGSDFGALRAFVQGFDMSQLGLGADGVGTLLLAFDWKRP